MGSLPAVSIVCPNLSSNALGRAWLLADLLRHETRVQIVGVHLEASIWAPAQDTGIPIHGYALRPGRRHYFDAVPWLREVVGSDLALVSKPVLQSLGLTLAAGIGRRGLIVDIDDWQSGFFQHAGAREGMTDRSQRAARLRSYVRRAGLNGFVLTRLLEAYASRRPHRLVSNRWLQRRFGGELLYHVRDPDELDPALPSSSAIPPLPHERTWVGFVGTPRGHKGIRALVDAVAAGSRRAPLGLALMGVGDLHDPEVVHAEQTLGRDALRVFPPFPLRSLRDHLRLVDILTVPSLEVPGSWGQIPAKLFDAMSMAKPVVASAVNDIPEILDGVGVCVPPGDVGALERALVELAQDSGRAARLGQAARHRLIEKYSYATGRRTLIDLVRRAAQS
jgi:glycosyltransferase involved in cell wall biosynthesis